MKSHKVTVTHNAQKDRKATDRGYILTYHFDKPLNIEEYHFTDKILKQPCWVKCMIRFDLNVTSNSFHVLLPSKHFFEGHKRRILNRIIGKLSTINNQLNFAVERRMFSEQLIRNNPPITYSQEWDDNLVNIEDEDDGE